MCARARLAASEFDKNSNISVRESIAFNGSTLHGHDFYELEIITSGSTPCALNGKEALAECGTVFFLTPADFHEYSPSDGFDLYNIQFTPEALSSNILERLISARERIFMPTGEVFQSIKRLTAEMHSLFTSGKSPEILTRLLECLLLLLADGMGNGGYTSAESMRDVQKAIIYLHAHFKENPSLSEVAATLPLNKNYFCTKFREYTGQSYNEYLKALKLRYARRLVLSTSLSMIEIAERSGYSTQSHFNREFKEYYATTPLKLRMGRL